MAGSPKKRQRREREERKAAREQAKTEQHPQAKPGSPEWSAWMAEKRRQSREERKKAQAKGLAPEPATGNETQEEKDERAALNLLREQMGATDEKVSQTAAIKMLEHRRREREGEDDEPEAIVYETAFAPEAYTLLREFAKDEAAA